MTEEQTIWTSLMSKLNNPYGVAAIMGNLFIESKLDPTLLQSSYARKHGITSAEYTDAVDKRTYTRDQFINDKAGYGLAQWTYYSRKDALYQFAVDVNKSIGDLQMQIDFFWREVQSYKTVIESLKNATSVKDASDTFAKRYEKPYDTSETALKRRSDKAQDFYDKYADLSPVPKRKYVRIIADRVNVRSGPGKNNKAYFQANTGTKVEWCNTNKDGWNAIVMWVHPDFSEVIEE